MKTGVLTSCLLDEFQNRNMQKNADKLQEGIKADGIRISVFMEQNNKEEWFQHDMILPEHRRCHQGQTGRCWIYAAFNMISPMAAKKYHMQDFLFSQNYIAFYDLLEKANYFLELILETVKEDTDSRFLDFKLRHPIQDAGQWSFFQNIVQKYGCVPKEAMPDTIHSRNTSELIGVLSDMLREDACILRSQSKKAGAQAELRLLKKEMLYAVYRILVMSLGRPPGKIETRIKRKDGTTKVEKNITPMEFYHKYICEYFQEDYCVIVNVPMDDKPFYENYCVAYLGNVWEAEKLPFLNVPMHCFKELVRKQLTAGIPVWFGCDSRVFGDRKNGIFTLENYDLQRLGFQNRVLEKKENLEYGISFLTHAMVIKGCSYDSVGRIDKWLVENSYGEETGHNGYLSVSDEWFDLFVYEAVIHKSFLDQTTLEDCKKESILVQPWDVLGTLAG